MKNIDIVITMAGLGFRFREAGYNMPKYMIEVKGKTLFEWSLLSLDGCKDDANLFIFIVLKDNKEDVKNFITRKCKKLNINNYKIILLEKVTDGQATTALMAREFWKENNPLLIYNIDTYVESGEIKSKDFKGDGFIPCFKGEGNHYSFVRLNEKGEVVEIKEKERISDYCTLGAYYFKTCRLYQELYKEFYEGEKTDKEKYIAPMYDYLLKKGGEIYISDINQNKVHVLGTPKELEIFKH